MIETLLALLLGAFIMYGIQPGPLLFQSQAALVWRISTSGNCTDRTLDGGGGPEGRP